MLDLLTRGGVIADQLVTSFGVKVFAVFSVAISFQNSGASQGGISKLLFVEFDFR
jgi:hypothetical protein